MIGDIYGRPEQFALLFGANAVLMAITILVVERLVRRLSTFPVLFAQTLLIVMVAIIYVVVSNAESGIPSFWVWFALASTLTAFNSGSTPLMQTLSMEPMGRIAGTASSVTGAVVFIGGALLGSLIDSAIVDTVTPFGVGFLIYGSISAIATWLGYAEMRRMR
jgi:DHA1 family bicyclomycin/chloramphenicol resistance-like MFS transporter